MSYEFSSDDVLDKDLSGKEEVQRSHSVVYSINASRSSQSFSISQFYCTTFT